MVTPNRQLLSMMSPEQGRLLDKQMRDKALDQRFSNAGMFSGIGRAYAGLMDTAQNVVSPQVGANEQQAIAMQAEKARQEAEQAKAQAEQEAILGAQSSAIGEKDVEKLKATRDKLLASRNPKAIEVASRIQKQIDAIQEAKAKAEADRLEAEAEANKPIYTDKQIGDMVLKNGLSEEEALALEGATDMKEVAKILTKASERSARAKEGSSTNKLYTVIQSQIDKGLFTGDSDLLEIAHKLADAGDNKALQRLIVAQKEVIKLAEQAEKGKDKRFSKFSALDPYSNGTDLNYITAGEDYLRGLQKGTAEYKLAELAGLVGEDTPFLDTDIIEVDGWFSSDIDQTDEYHESVKRRFQFLQDIKTYQINNPDASLEDSLKYSINKHVLDEPELPVNDLDTGGEKPDAGTISGAEVTIAGQPYTMEQVLGNMAIVNNATPEERDLIRALIEGKITKPKPDLTVEVGGALPQRPLVGGNTPRDLNTIQEAQRQQARKEEQALLGMLSGR